MSFHTAAAYVLVAAGRLAGGGAGQAIGGGGQLTVIVLEVLPVSPTLSVTVSVAVLAPAVV